MEYRYHNVDDVQDDTCSWLLKHPYYKEWHSGTASSNLLMIRGKPGSGKSTAVKKACKLVKESSRADEAVISFFFNSRGSSMETKLEGFFRSALHQLLEQSQRKDEEAFAAWKRKASSIKAGWTWTVNELQDMFVGCVRRSTAKLLLFVDALDECESASSARNLVELLTKSGHGTDSCRSSPRICVSSRHYPNVSGANPLQITVEDTNALNISTYTKNILRPLLSDLDGLADINAMADFHALARKIAARSNGIFLWAVLVLRQIREAVANGEPRKTLYNIIESVPRGLEELFQELMESTPVEQREQRDLIMMWIVFARRPLTLSELNQALAFRQEYPTYRDYERSAEYTRPDQMLRLLVNRTRGLVEVVATHVLHLRMGERAQTSRVQFIHESVREYVLSQETLLAYKSTLKWSDSGFAHNAMASSCFNYIKTVHVEASLIEVSTISSTSSAISHDSARTRIADSLTFLEYAIEFGIEHAEAAEAGGPPQLPLFESVTDGKIGTVPWWKSFVDIFRKLQKRDVNNHRQNATRKHWSDFVITQLAFACAFNIHSWVKHLLTANKVPKNKLDLSKALCVTAISGVERNLHLLIQAGANVNHSEPNFGTPLYLALVNKRFDMVKFLLRQNASARQGPHQHSPLLAAVQYGPSEVVRLLLARGARVAERTHGTHALEAAITRTDLEIIEALLEAAESQKVRVGYYKQALWDAQLPYSLLHNWEVPRDEHVKCLKSALARIFPEHAPVPLYVKSLNTPITFTVHMWLDARVALLKEFIYRRRGLTPDQFQLVLMSRMRLLRDEQTLCQSHVVRNSTIYMIPRARWGGLHGG